jgi:hypothetical protein
MAEGEGMTNEEVAARWAEGLSGDWAILATLTSPTMQVWHSHDDQWLDTAASQARMDEAGGPPRGPVFDAVKVHVTQGGFVVQAALHGIAGAARTHIVQILTVEDGLVARCEEYIAPTMTLGS